MYLFFLQLHLKKLLWAQTYQQSPWSVLAWWWSLPAPSRPTLKWILLHCIKMAEWFQTKQTREFGLRHLALVARWRTNVRQTILLAPVAVKIFLSQLKVRPQRSCQFQKVINNKLCLWWEEANVIHMLNLTSHGVNCISGFSKVLLLPLLTYIAWGKSRAYFF